MKNILIDPFKGYLRRRKEKQLVEELDKFVFGKGVEITDFIKTASKDLEKVWEQFTKEISSVFEKMGIKTVLEEKEFYSLNEYVSLLTKHKIEDCDAIAVMKEDFDGKMRFIAAYMKGDEMIEEKQNCFVILIADKVDEDFMSLFSDSNIIKLK